MPDEELETAMTEKLEELQKIASSAEKRAEKERKTVLQYKDPVINFADEKKDYLTASKFGMVCRRRPYTAAHSSIMSIMYPADLGTNEYVKFGVDNEDLASQIYMDVYNVTVEKCGLFIYEKVCYLAASPDGLVGDNGLVEVKCVPSIEEDKIRQAVAEKKLDFLTFDEDTLVLKSSHKYWYQIQGQLNITGREYCDLIVFAKTDTVFLRIYKNTEVWEEDMLPKLQCFYMECMLPELCDSRIAREQKARNGEYITNAILQKAERDAKKDANETVQVTSANLDQ